MAPARASHPLLLRRLLPGLSWQGNLPCLERRNLSQKGEVTVTVQDWEPMSNGAGGDQPIDSRTDGHTCPGRWGSTRRTGLPADRPALPHFGEIPLPKPTPGKLENAARPVTTEVALDGSGHSPGVGPLAAHPGNLFQEALIQHKNRAFHRHKPTTRSEKGWPTAPAAPGSTAPLPPRRLPPASPDRPRSAP